MSIPSPYGFVPLAGQVVFPDWADQVSMDIPFEDGISGVLQIKVTARTPIYIRNGGNHPEGIQRLTDRAYVDFFRVLAGGPYAIPGSSLKGMLRTVLEIASFGKIVGGKSAPRVDDHRYAVRDLTRGGTFYTSKITRQAQGGYAPKVKAAWLSEDENGRWQLTPCAFARVEQTELERWRGGACRLDNRGAASTKYRHIPPGTRIQFDCGEETAHPHSRGTKLVYRKAGNLGKGSVTGTIVLTGQPSPRTGAPGRKHMEFIFFQESNKPFDVPKSVKDDFIFAHSELGENRSPNAEWGFWRPRLKRGERVPIFYLGDDRAVQSMGLAMMYRLPYRHSIHETIEHTSRDHSDGSRPDMGELIFGRVEDTYALRGRVAMETLVADGTPSPMERIETVLNGPKPTFYPNYLEQHTQRDGTVRAYRTYMDDSAEIRGWKRYLARQDNAELPGCPDPPRNREGVVNREVATAFRPLPSGTSFIGDLHVHNLRPVELGALIWAITWGNNPRLRHTLGMGKPYGFGSVTLEITQADLSACSGSSEASSDITQYMDAFIAYMNTIVPGWSEGQQLKALQAMANPDARWMHELRYPRLGEGPRQNEFVQAKQAGQTLFDPVQGQTRQQPRQQEQARQASAQARPVAVAAPAREQSKAEKFLAGIETMSLKNIPKNLKALELSPEQVTPQERSRIHASIKRKPGAMTRPEIKALLAQWNPN